MYKKNALVKALSAYPNFGHLKLEFNKPEGMCGWSLPISALFAKTNRGESREASRNGRLNSDFQSSTLKYQPLKKNKI